MTTPETRTADQVILDHIADMFESLQATFAEVAENGDQAGIDLALRGCTLVYNGAARAELVAKAEEQANMKVELFQTGINTAFTSEDGKITIKFA